MVVDMLTDLTSSNLLIIVFHFNIARSWLTHIDDYTPTSESSKHTPTQNFADAFVTMRGTLLLIYQHINAINNNVVFIKHFTKPQSALQYAHI